jgi:pantoate--beta-alanine ligase
VKVLRTVAELRAERARTRHAGLSCGFVPTMGALHAGHLSLVRAARAAHASVGVSIFVNPTQFGPNEDFARYPRTWEADCALLEAEGVNWIFAPSAEEMYPAGATTNVHVGGVSERLDGASRPGHFDGVATVVAKLFHLAEPDEAFFGQKDAAQVAVLRAMVRDLNFPVRLVVCPTVREADGLAMSSRNRYLSAEERVRALVLSRAFRAAQTLYERGERSAAALLDSIHGVLAGEPAARLDYAAVVDADTLLPVDQARTGTLCAVAAHLGATRLIDNVVL